MRIRLPKQMPRPLKGLPRYAYYNNRLKSQEERLCAHGYLPDAEELQERFNVGTGHDALRQFIGAMLEAEISMQINRIRVGKGWTQEKVAGICGWATTRVSYLERGEYKHWPSLETLANVAAALGVGMEVRFVPLSKVIESRVELEYNGECWKQSAADSQSSGS